MSSTKLRVKELLRERRWTTKVLAEKAGMSESYLTHIKNSTRRWNEDALKKLSEAFNVDPVDLFANRNNSSSSTSFQDMVYTDEELQPGSGLNRVRVVPVLGEIPSEPSVFNNQKIQVESGFENQFVATFNVEDSDVFCLQIKDSSLAPRFMEGDQLIISPQVWTRSGDIVAVEYNYQNETKKGIYQVNYMDDFVILESVCRKSLPIPLIKGKDNFKIIGKVIWRYQKLN